MTHARSRSLLPLGSSSSVLSRLLNDDEALARVARASPDEVLALINNVGLEDAGEVIALLTTPQLEAVFDDDLWRRERGREAFDPLRFGLWLEVMLELGAEAAARRVCDLYERDPAVIVAGFAALCGVFNVDDMAVRGRHSDDEFVDELDAVIADRRSHEIDGLLLVSRDDAAFDAVVHILTSIDDERLLRRLCAVTQGAVDHDGLSSALSERESAAEDAAAAREERRRDRGFVSFDDARAFLAATGVGGQTIARVYLEPWTQRPSSSSAASPPSHDAAALMRPSSPRGAVGQALLALDSSTSARRRLEIAFLANVIVAAHAVRPADAAALVLDVIGSFVTAGADLAETDAVTLFLRRPH